MENNARIAKGDNNKHPFKKLNALILQLFTAYNILLKNYIVILKFAAFQSYFGYNL